jgi:hypothetical protein
MTDKVWEYKSNDDDKLKKLVKDKGKSIVMTNPKMAKYLIDRIQFEEGDIVCEPCKGDGAFYDNLPNNVEKIWYEINEGRNYLEGEKQIVSHTLSNPPFVPRKLFWDFMERAMETTTKKIYWLINLQSMNVFTPKRLEIMKSKNWYINSQHIVADKRWYGRYCWLEIGKNDNNYYSWKNGKSF